jgi:hypothetical protein
MGKFGCEHDLSALIIDNGKTRDTGAWIELESESLHLRLCSAGFEDKREGITPQHCRLPRC